MLRATAARRVNTQAMPASQTSLQRLLLLLPGQRLCACPGQRLYQLPLHGVGEALQLSSIYLGQGGALIPGQQAPVLLGSTQVDLFACLGHH